MQKTKRAFAGLTVAVMTAATLLITPTAALAAPFEYCYDNVVLTAGEGRVVSVERDYTGGDANMLRARGTDPRGPWEQFRICWATFDWPAGYNSMYVYIYSLSAHQWVASENQYTGSRYGMLRARSAEIGPWEMFRMVNIEGTEGVAILGSNGNWVSDERTYTGASSRMLRARTTELGPWEMFKVYDAETMLPIHYLFAPYHK